MEFLKNLLFSKLKSYPLAAHLDPEDKRDIPVEAFSVPVSIPLEYKTDLSIFKNLNQFGLGTCVSQWIRMAFQWLWFVKTGQKEEFSARSNYGLCKKKDGIADLQGTFPRIAAGILPKEGIARLSVVPDNNTLSHEEYIALPYTSAVVNEMYSYRTTGYATCFPIQESLKQNIYRYGVVGVTFGLDANWFSGIIKKVLSIIGYHRVLLYGYDADGFFGKNWWGESWIAKVANKIFPNGDFYIYWKDYEGNTYDPIIITDIPKDIIDHVKGLNYFFTKTMKYGENSYDIAQLQKRMDKEGVWDKKVSKNGQYGNTTRTAVKAFQKAHGISSDGSLVGPLTLRALNGAKLPVHEAIIKVESNGNLYAIGDKTLKFKAYGCMQIRQPACEDVNARYGTKYRAEDTLGNKQLSLDIFEKYTTLDNPKPTDEDRMKSWNGGRGWKYQYGRLGFEEYTKDLDNYVAKVKSLM